MNRSKSIVIVPVYNESENIAFIVRDLLSAENCDVVFVNDASRDDSLQKLLELNQTVVDLPINLGIGGCMQTGYKYAWEMGYDIAVQYDGDGQHCACDIGILTGEIEKGADYAIGSRFVSGEGYKSSKSRRIGIRMLSGVIRLLTGTRINDVTSGFRACSREVIGLFAKYYPRDYPEPEVTGALARNGYKLSEVAVKMRARQGGVSSIRPLKSVYYMIKVTVAILFSPFVYPKKGK